MCKEEEKAISKEVIHFYDNLYMTNYYVVISKYKEDYKLLLSQFLSEEEMSQIELNGTGKCIEIEDVGYAIFVEDKNSPDESYDVNLPVLVHEILHAVNMNFEIKNISMSYDKDEHYCYYVQMVLDQVLRQMKEGY